MRKKLLLILSLFFLIFFFGCIANNSIEDRDHLNSTMNFDLSDFMQGVQRPINGVEPCTCMVCTKENPSAWYDLFGPLSKDQKESALSNSKCDFAACNASTYSQTLGDFDKKTQDWGVCKFDGEKKLCAPRFFMLGTGISSAEFSMAQRYCAGELTMPVIWTTPQENKPPSVPIPQTLMCHLTKSQMPVVVWYSRGKYTSSQAGSPYSNMLKSFYNPSADPEVSGPIMVTTEALADPYQNLDQTNGKKILNLTALENAKKQIEAIKKDCKNCLSVLALKPTFNETGMPDLCPLDYFFRYRPQDEDPRIRNPDADVSPDPLNCASNYTEQGADYFTRPAQTYKVPGEKSSSGFGSQIDLIGIAFNANENANLTTCTPQKSIARHLMYSKKALNNFYAPSVWYAIAMSEGPTKDPGCTFSQDAISKAYYDLMKGSSGFVSSGVIGIAPYKLLDSPLSGPLECKAQTAKENILAASLDDIKAGQALEFENPKKDPIQVSKILQKEENTLLFQDKGGSTFLAYELGSVIALNQTGCQYGVIGMDGVVRNESQFSWFSSCQYYYNDRGPLFRTDSKGISKLSQIQPGYSITSSDKLFELYVEEIQSKSSTEVIFFASNGQIVNRFSAKQDGNALMIYDMPRVTSPQQALMFSINGVGAQCTAFESAEMFSRAPISQVRPKGAPAVEVAQDDQTMKRISQSMCGACLSYAPMPKAFCKWDGDYSFNEDTCLIYPEMDLAFLEKNVDPIFMRSIAFVESALGGANKPVSGYNSAACATSPNEKDTDRSREACMRGDKRPQAIIDSDYPKYCTSNDISRELSRDDIPPSVACGLGVFQCIDGPRSDYNPFNPYDSATCGIGEFLGGESGNRFLGMKKFIVELRASNPYLASEIKSSEIEWYAAWLAAYGYRGMVVPKDTLSAYKPRSDSDNIILYLVDYFEEKGQAEPNYGIKWIITYNEGIAKCRSGCPHQSCSDD